MRRVFIGPVEIAGIARGLAEGMREAGVDARVVLSAPYPFEGQADPVPALQRAWQRLGAARHATPRRQLVRKALLVVAHDLWGWLILAQAAWRFDAFLFLYGQTMTNSRAELRLLRFLGRKIVFIYTGSDARPPFMDGGWFPGAPDDPLPQAAQLAGLAKRTKRRIRLQESHAHYTVNSPATAHFHERPFINWFAMGIPKRPPVLPGSRWDGARKVRILHAPSNPAVKGSALIVRIVEGLAAKGLPVELVQIQGMPNRRVLEELANCDFVVDQLYSDTPLAAFATEAAFFGKPAVVGGCFAAQAAQAIGPGDMPPSLYVEPGAVGEAVERLARDEALRRELGERARRFVEERWNSVAVARRYLGLLRDDVPATWWCDPGDVRYVEGCGLPRERARRLVQLLVEHAGAGALQVSDKPALEAAFLALARRPAADSVDA